MISKWYLTFKCVPQVIPRIGVYEPPYKVYKKTFDKNITLSLLFYTIEYKEIMVEWCTKMKCKFESAI